MFEPFKFIPVNNPPERNPSMVKRIAAITFIFLCTTVAWAILGATIFQRTYDSGSSSDSRVRWLAALVRSEERRVGKDEQMVPKKEVTNENGKQIERVTQEKVSTDLPLASS